MAYVFRRPSGYRVRPKRIVLQSGVSASVNLTQVSGIGVAHAITPNPGAQLVGVAGIGVAGSLATSISITITGVAGVGAVGSLTTQVAINLSGVAGVGVARSLSPSISIAITGVAATGQAGSIVPSDAPGTFTGVSGTGTAGILAPLVATTINVVAGIGVAGSLVPSVQVGTLQGVSGVGSAGTIGVGVGGNFVGVQGSGVAGIITVSISGGGGKKKLEEPEAPKRRDPRLKPAFEQLAKRPKPPKAADDGDVLPPYRDPPPLAPSIEPAPVLDAPSAVLPFHEQIRRQVMDALDQSDIERLLYSHDQDEQDIADIDAMLEFLD